MREVSAEGRSVARIDDETVTAGRLAAVVEPLIEIHGQHEQQRLLSAAWQRDVLDAYGGHQALRQAVAAAVEALRANEAALRELSIEPEELARRLELAEHAADEIEAAAPRPGEVEELRGRLGVAGNAQRVAALLDEAYELLAGESRGARDQVARASAVVAELARLDPSAQALADRVAGVEAETDDIALELRRRSESFGESTLDAEAIEARLGVLYGLCASTARPRSRSSNTPNRPAPRPIGCAASIASANGGARGRAIAGRGIGGGRRAPRRAGHRRRKAVRRRDRPARRAWLSIGRLRRRDGARHARSDRSRHGLLPARAEPGRAAAPLARIASGGEMSRVALALKTVLAAPMRRRR